MPRPSLLFAMSDALVPTAMIPGRLTRHRRIIHVLSRRWRSIHWGMLLRHCSGAQFPLVTLDQLSSSACLKTQQLGPD